MVNLFGDNLVVPSGNSETLGLPCRTVDSAPAITLEFHVADHQMLTLQSNQSGHADLSLGFLNPPAPPAVKHVELQASNPLVVRVPNTGKSRVWQVWIRIGDVGMLRVCSEVAPVVTRLSRYEELAASFTPGQGWSYIMDATASSHWAAQAVANSAGPEGAYGATFRATTGAYDVWYRIRVADGSGRTPEMLLTVVDLEANRYLSAASFSPSQVGTAYRWMLVASGVTPDNNHQLRFQTNIGAQLSTNWYIDEAAMVPAGAPMPESVA